MKIAELFTLCILTVTLVFIPIFSYCEEGGSGRHLPLFDGVMGIGANGFYYQQVTGDSGSGAIAGDFKGMTRGVGPVVSYSTKICGKDVDAEVKWLPEIDVEKRLKGDPVWFKLVVQC